MRYALLALLLALAFPAAAQGLHVAEPWVREAPPTAQVMAAYLTLHNHGDQARALVGVSARGFGRVELHRTVMEQGVARMEHIPRLDVPAGGSAVLEPGGYHLMLMQPQRVPPAGGRVSIELQFDDGATLAFEAPVQRRAAAGGHGGHGHGHHHGH